MSEEQSVEASIEAMNELHAELGRKAAQLALDVLESVKPENIPVASAVSLLKFGVDLERKALLGVEDDGDGDDPFELLAKQLAGGENTEDEKAEEG